MGHYASLVPTPPRVPTEAEQKLILKVTGEHRDGYRDHVIVATALATGLRAHELLALDVSDILDSEGRVTRLVVLRTFKRSSTRPPRQEVVLPEGLRRKLKRYLAWERRRGEPTEPESPLFLSRKRNRLSTRQLRHLFRTWQGRAGIERPYNFHQLRHAACTALYRRTKDIRLTARFARHKSLVTTERYAHATLEELVAAVQELPC